MLLLCVSACGGSGTDSPTSPSPGALAPPTAFRATVIPRLRANIVRFSWTPGPGATSHVVEIGRMSRAADVATLTTTMGEDQLDWPAEPGEYFARVKARTENASSAPSNEVGFSVVRLEDVIEALFLQSGSLVSPCDPNWPAAMVGFPRGITLRFRISTSLSDGQIAVAREMAARIPELSQGAFQVVIDVTSEIPEAAELRRASVLEHDVVVTRGNPMGAEAVAGILWADQARGLFESGIITLASTAGDSVVRHEMGHMPLGMCHISAGGLGPSNTSLMSDQRGPLEPTPLDVEALRAVYVSGLSPGATRSDFAAAGLVIP